VGWGGVLDDGYGVGRFADLVWYRKMIEKRREDMRAWKGNGGRLAFNLFSFLVAGFPRMRRLLRWVGENGLVGMRKRAGVDG
jgi:hypothetical protein